MLRVDYLLLKSLVDKTERLKDFYEVGPVQRAAVEDFFLNVKEAIIKEVREELVGEQYIEDCFDLEEHMFYAGNDTGVLDSLTRIENFGMVNNDKLEG